MEIEYKIATSATATELSNKVNDLIKDGWKPVDSIKYIQFKDTSKKTHVFTQTLTRISSKF